MADRLRHSNLVFRLSCWLLGLIAFGQFLVAGVALAVRVEKAQEVRVIEKIVPKLITVAPAAPAVAVAPPSPKAVALPPMPEPTPLPPARPLSAPPIADPVVERLVTEARKARVADDMGTAFNKLESAHDAAPKDPNVLYELALVYEEMAVASGGDTVLANKASDAYMQILDLGTTGAGSLYTLAAAKLRDGIAMPADLRGEMALGRTRIFKDDDFEGGQRVVLTVPVTAATGTEVGDDDLLVRVRFFDSMMRNGKREIVPTSVEVPEDQYKWVTLPFDFAGGEELLRVTYVLPSEDLQQTHLFGRRSYYGQVVELIYKGEVLDTQAWPRHLSSRGEAEPPQPDDMPEFLTEDMIDYNSANPLLPTKQGDFLPEPGNPDGSLPPPPPDN